MNGDVADETYRAQSRTCHHSSMVVVCDTADEAMNAIHQFRKSQMALLHTFIRANEKHEAVVVACPSSAKTPTSEV